MSDESVAIPSDMEKLSGVHEEIHAVAGFVTLEFISDGQVQVYAKYSPAAAVSLATRLIEAAQEVRYELKHG